MRRHRGAWPEPSRHARHPRGVRALLIALGWLAACSPDAAAEVLLVGPQRNLQAPSDAAAVANDGDVVRIDPGDYVDCAIWRASDLVLEAPDGAAHVRDRACGGKAIWVIAGDDVTVDNITFSGARVPDQNGAGIRAEGRNLTIRNSRFFDNENGILAAPVEGSTILIERSLFERNGKCAANCAHGLYVNRIDHLKIVDSTFREQRAGHHIKSGARTTEVIGSTIEDGQDGTASYLIDIVAGDEVVIADNVMAKGPRSENWGTAIHISGKDGDPGRSRVSDQRQSLSQRQSARGRFRAQPDRGPGGPGGKSDRGRRRPAGRTRDGRCRAGSERTGGRTGSAGKRTPAAGAEEPAAGPAAFDDLEARLRFLKRLFEEELITEQEYAAKKAELLEEM